MPTLEVLKAILMELAKESFTLQNTTSTNLSWKGILILTIISAQIFCTLFLLWQLFERRKSNQELKNKDYSSCQLLVWKAKVEAAAQRIQAVVRGHQKRSFISRWNQACVAIQRQTRGNFVRKRLPIKDRKLLKVSGDNESPSVKPSEKGPQEEDLSLLLLLSDLRKLLRSVIVIQSWYRMVKTRRAYLKLFCSMNTAPVQNRSYCDNTTVVPQETNTNTATSFISNLSSWSSTWTKPKQQSTTKLSAIDQMVASISSVSEKLSKSGSEFYNHDTFIASPSDTEALKFSITAYAAAIQIQSWWKTYYPKLKKKKKEETEKQLANNVQPNNTLKSHASSSSQSSIFDTEEIYTRPAKNRRADSNKNSFQYYAKYWTKTLEKVSVECSNMCASVDISEIKCEKRSDESSQRGGEDSFDVQHTSTTEVTHHASGGTCNAMLLHHTPCYYFQHQDLTEAQTTVVAAMNNIPICAAQRTTFETFGNSSVSEDKDEDDNSIYYAPTYDHHHHQEFLQHNQQMNSTIHTFSTPSINTFSSPSTNYTYPSSIDESNRQTPIHFGFVCSPGADGVGHSSMESYYSTDEDDTKSVPVIDGQCQGTHFEARETPYYACAI